MGEKEFIESIDIAVKKFKDFLEKGTFLVFHDDADGVCSAGIMNKALEREGIKVKTLCLEKTYPQVLDFLHSKKNQTIFYTDIGGAHANLISKINKSKNLVIILDHHAPEESADPLVINLSSDLFGISGASDASGSTVSYFFARELNEKNKDMGYLAVIGSVEIPGNLRGLNRKALNDARKNVEIKEIGEKEKYRIISFNNYARRISTLLTVLTSVGYYRDGPMLALKSCMNGKFSEEAKSLAHELEEKRKNINKEVMGELRKKGLNQTKYTQWFHVEDSFKGMGTKVIGSFCSFLKFQKVINPVKYLLGFMNMSNEIPGFGKLEKKDLVKVSIRVPKILERLIKEKKMPHAGNLLKKSIEEIKGIIGEGHPFAASGVIFKGQEEELIGKIEELIGKKSTFKY